MNKVIISVAPVPGNATCVKPENVVEEMLKCADEGAAMVHLHSKDAKGQLTADIAVLSQIISGIRNKKNLIIEASTGGISNLNIQERCTPLDDNRVELASLNVGSVNLGDAVYSNSIPDVKYCTAKILEKKILPDIEVFELGMINNVKIVADELGVEIPLFFNIVLGQRGAMQATEQNLKTFLQYIPKNALWGFTHYGRRDFSLVKMAVELGAAVIRVGYEDSKWLVGETEAKSNAEQVKEAARVIRAAGSDIASPDEARKILALKPVA